MAPWNTSRYPSKDLILWHFHGFRLLESRKLLLHSGYKISKIIDDQIYQLYVSQILLYIKSDKNPEQIFFKYNTSKKKLQFILSRLWLTIISFKPYSLKPRIKIIKY